MAQLITLEGTAQEKGKKVTGYKFPDNLDELKFPFKMLFQPNYAVGLKEKITTDKGITFKNINVPSREVIIVKKDAVAAAEAIASNPGIQNQIHVTLVGEAAENFINGKGFTEDKLKKAMGENLWKQEGPAIKRARKAKTGKVADTIKKPTAAVTLKNMGKLKGTLGQQWANFQNASASAENITNAVGSAIKGNDISLKTKLGIIDTVTKKLKVKLGSKQGAWVLTKHIKSSTFPDFTKWAVDVKSAGVTRTLTETDYLVSKSIWNLTK
jgi:hypothetical protein